MSKIIDPVDIRKAVKDGELEFYVEKDTIYCRELPVNGEIMIVGKVGDEIKEPPDTSVKPVVFDFENGKVTRCSDYYDESLEFTSSRTKGCWNCTWKNSCKWANK